MDSVAIRNSRVRLAGVVIFAFLLALSACSQEKQKRDPRQEHLESMMAILAQVQKILAEFSRKRLLLNVSLQVLRGRIQQMSNRLATILLQASALSIPRWLQAKI